MDRDSKVLLEQINKPGKFPADIDIESIRASGRETWIRYTGWISPDCDIEDVHITDCLPARLYRPHKAGKPITVVYFHGGGWTMGDIDCYDGLMSYLAGVGGYTALSVGYRLAPEHPFPAAFGDCRDAVMWIRRQGNLPGVDTSGLVLMGDSAGATLAASLAVELNRLESLELAALCLIYPLADLHSPHETYPSRLKYGDGNYLIGREGIDLARALYLPAGQDARDPRVSPIFSEELWRLPPTLLVTAGFDPLKDEGFALADSIRSTGVPVKYRCFDSTMHAFMSFGDLPVAREARDYVIRELDDFINHEQ